MSGIHSTRPPREIHTYPPSDVNFNVIVQRSRGVSVAALTHYPGIPQRVNEVPTTHIAGCAFIEGLWTFAGSHTTGVSGRASITLTGMLSCFESSLPDNAVLEMVLPRQPTAQGARNLLDDASYIGRAPYFVATPVSDQPCFLTFAVQTVSLGGIGTPPDQVLPDRLDVTVEVRSWNHDGTPAVNVEFHWMAIGEQGVRHRAI
jgi:hypothetical protein